MSYAQTSTYRRTIRNIFVGRNALYGFRIVSILAILFKMEYFMSFLYRLRTYLWYKNIQFQGILTFYYFDRVISFSVILNFNMF